MAKPTSSVIIPGADAALTNPANAYDGDSSTFANGSTGGGTAFVGSEYRFTLAGQQACVGIRVDWEAPTGGANGTITVKNNHPSGIETLVSHVPIFARATETFYFSPTKTYTSGTVAEQIAVSNSQGNPGSIKVYEIELLVRTRGDAVIIDG